MPEFVPAADEVWRLQNDGDPECIFFRRSVRGDEAKSNGTMQGTYVFAPSGKLLARRNTSNPEAIFELLKNALEAWKELPIAERQLASEDLVDPGFRWEQSCPTDGLVLRRTARDLPLDGDSSPVARGRFNREAVWFSAEEARSFLAATPVLGQRYQLPELITKRLSCLVLVDNVGGQTVPYHPSEDVNSELWSEVIGIKAGKVSITISGHSAADSKGPWLFEGDNYWKPKADKQWPHSISTNILGNATFDLDSDRFTAFELLALGERRGRTVNQARRSVEASGIGFVCELAPEGWHIAPTFINVYDVDWVGVPSGATSIR
ncbi:MAG: hypothetical protein ACI8X5_002829 [Planctomycetota bacterium]|jgi:hypothetical protein